MSGKRGLNRRKIIHGSITSTFHNVHASLLIHDFYTKIVLLQLPYSLDLDFVDFFPFFKTKIHFKRSKIRHNWRHQGKFADGLVCNTEKCVSELLTEVQTALKVVHQARKKIIWKETRLNCKPEKIIKTNVANILTSSSSLILLKSP